MPHVVAMSRTGGNERLHIDVRARVARLGLELSQPLTASEPTTPLDAYMILFRERPSLRIQAEVRRLYASAGYAERGYVYVFRDSRDGDPALVKIGSSIHVRRRISEWRRDLGATEEELALLFTSHTLDVRLAEAIVHALLFYQWQPWRERADTGKALVEYFRVPQLAALEELIRAVARHVAWFTRMRKHWFR